MTAEPATILIVEDDPDILDVEADALTRKGYRVIKAHNGEDALEELEKGLPQLILLDMRMPVMDGWTFTQIVRDRFGRGIPIVVVTAADDSKLRAAEIGADADLGKPFELEELYEVVHDTLGAP
jgi:urea transport system substrate-binding protein